MMRDITQKLLIITIIWFVAACAGEVGPDTGPQGGPLDGVNKSVGAGIGGAADGTVPSQTSAGIVIPKGRIGLVFSPEPHQNGYVNDFDPPNFPASTLKIDSQVPCGAQCAGLYLRIIECGPLSNEDLSSNPDSKLLWEKARDFVERFISGRVEMPECKKISYRDLIVNPDSTVPTDLIAVKGNHLYHFALVAPSSEGFVGAFSTDEFRSFSSAEEYQQNFNKSNMSRVRVFFAMLTY